LVHFGINLINQRGVRCNIVNDGGESLKISLVGLMKKEYAGAALRLALGWTFLWAFLDKAFGMGYSTSSESAWINGGSPTSGFLAYATSGPFSGFYQDLAGNSAVDALNRVDSRDRHEDSSHVRKRTNAPDVVIGVTSREQPYLGRPHRVFDSPDIPGIGRSRQLVWARQVVVRAAAGQEIPDIGVIPGLRGMEERRGGEPLLLPHIHVEDDCRERSQAFMASLMTVRLVIALDSQFIS
jgi:hypothetical protein